MENFGDPPPSHIFIFSRTPPHLFLFFFHSAPPQDLKWNSPYSYIGFMVMFYMIILFFIPQIQTSFTSLQNTRSTLRISVLPSCLNAHVNMVYQEMDFPIGHNSIIRSLGTPVVQYPDVYFILEIPRFKPIFQISCWGQWEFPKRLHTACHKFSF